jgi:methionyl-tRNA formyltransferase
LRIVFMGSPKPVVPVLESLLSNGHEALAVYTPPDRPAGRGRSTQAPALKQAALRLGLPVVQVDSLRSAETIRQVLALGAEALVVAAFGYIVPTELLAPFPFGCLNIHPSLLPKYRGAAPVAAAILAGDEYAGVSVMRLEEGLDSGPIFAQAQLPISEADTAGSLTERLFRIGGGLLLEVLAELPRGRQPRPQGEAGVSFAPELKKAAGKIDWNLSAEAIGRRVRAFQPWPGAYTSWQNRQIKILEASPLQSALSLHPGQVAALPDGLTDSGLAIGTGSGVLAILRLQMEGKRPLSGEEFLRGQKAIAGAILS